MGASYRFSSLPNEQDWRPWLFYRQSPFGFSKFGFSNLDCIVSSSRTLSSNSSSRLQSALQHVSMTSHHPACPSRGAVRRIVPQLGLRGRRPAVGRNLGALDFQLLIHRSLLVLGILCEASQGTRDSNQLLWLDRASQSKDDTFALACTL